MGTVPPTLEAVSAIHYWHSWATPPPPTPLLFHGLTVKGSIILYISTFNLQISIEYRFYTAYHCRKSGMTEAVAVPGATSGVSVICWMVIKYWGTANKMVPSVPTLNTTFISSPYILYYSILYSASISYLEYHILNIIS